MKNIDIKKPCSENWHEMTPTEKGAFCLKCTTDVHDFTNKSTDEIRAVLKESNGGFMCGRVKTGQLELLESEYQFWKQGSAKQYRSAVMFSFIVVFGLTMFSCSTKQEAKAIQSIQEIVLNVMNSESETVSKINPIHELENLVKSEIDYVEIEPIRHEYIEMGEITMDEQAVYAITETRTEVMISGGIGMNVHYLDYLDEVVPEKIVERELDINGIPYPTEFESLVYPNPASTSTSLKFMAPLDFNGRIEMYDMSGKQIMSLHEGNIERGTHEFEINLIDVKPGSYIITLYSEVYKESVKFIKL